MKNKSMQSNLGKFILFSAILTIVLIIGQPAFSAVEVSGSWGTGLTHSPEAGTNRLLVFIAHARHGVRYLSLDSVTYGGQPMTKVTDCNAVNQGRIYSVAYVLNEAGIAAATNSDFVVTWRVTSTVPQYALPSAVGYSSAFLKGVSQDSSLGATGIKAVISNDTISLNSGLATDNGDMVIYGVSENSAGGGTIAPNNGFTEGIEQLILQSGTAVGTGETGYKPASGLDETPSSTFTVTANSQAMLGFVVNLAYDANKTSNPSPTNYAVNTAIDANLSWSSVAGTAYYDLYFGTDPVAHNNPSTRLYTTSYDPPADLSFTTQYYWAVDTNINDTVFVGDSWNFTTAPDKISNPSPYNDEPNVAVTTNLDWTDAPRVTNYEVYFGTDSAVRNNSKTIVYTNSYDPPGNLDLAMRYYWVVDVNYNGTIHPGDAYNFISETAVDANYLIATWQGFKQAAITYSFDDAPSAATNQIPVAIPMLNERGLKATFNLVTSWQDSNSWISFSGADANGHEIASHFTVHDNPADPCIQDSYLKYSQEYIEANIPGDSKCVTVVYPNCVEPTESLVAKYYIAGRKCDSVLASSSPANFYQLPAYILGSSGLNTTAAITERADAAATQGGWCIYLIHNLISGGFSPLSEVVFGESLDYLVANSDRFWVGTFANVVKYIKERNDASIVEISQTDANVVLRVSAPSLLDANIYNYPLSIRKPLPANWMSAYGSQNGMPIDVSIVQVGSQKYIVFDAVPNGGNIVLQNLYGDFDGNGIVDYQDLPDIIDYWLIYDCNETAAGIDLNADCRVNFYEFSVMAENWMQQH